jgi:hypothetical protein
VAIRRFVGVLSVIGRSPAGELSAHGRSRVTHRKQLSLTSNSITMKLEAN